MFGEIKKFGNWLETDRAKAYIDHVSIDVGILPIDLIESRKGGKGGGGGSWIHKTMTPESRSLDCDRLFFCS